MILRHYRPLLRIVGLLVVACSGISGALLWAAPPPTGLRNIDPQTVKNSLVAVVLVLGAVLPLAAVFSPAVKWLVAKAAVFAAAAFTNSAALSPHVAVAFQSTTSAIAVAGGLALAVISLVAFMDIVQRRKPESKF